MRMKRAFTPYGQSANLEKGFRALAQLLKSEDCGDRTPSLNMIYHQDCPYATSHNAATSSRTQRIFADELMMSDDADHSSDG